MLHWHCKVLTTAIEPIHKCSCSRKWTSPSVIFHQKYKVSNSLNRIEYNCSGIMCCSSVLSQASWRYQTWQREQSFIEGDKVAKPFLLLTKWTLVRWWATTLEKRQGAACRLDWTHSVLIPRRFRSYRKTVTLPGSVHNIFGRNLATKSSELKDIKPLEAQNGQND